MRFLFFEKRKRIPASLYNDSLAMEKRYMWKYVKRYLHFGALAALFMVGEVLMDLIQPGLMARIVDEGILGLSTQGTGDPHFILTMGLAMVGLVLFGGLCGSCNNVFVHITGQSIGNEIRKDCFRAILSFSFPQMDRFGTGSLVTRVTNDITQVQNFVAQFVRGMIRTSMLMVGSLFFLYRLHPPFGRIVLCAFPLILGCMLFCLWKASPLLTKLQTRLDEINSLLQEDVSGIRIIKACVRESYEKLRFGKANDKLIKTQLQVLVIFAFMNPVMNTLMYTVVVLLLLSGSHEVSAGLTTPGTIMAAITYTTQLLNGILMLVMLFQTISKGVTSWRRVKEILTSQPEMEDGTLDGETPVHGTVQFENVSFAYPGREQTVLRHINLTIHPGETIAILGATGCGKTALVSLIPRFYDTTEGRVLVDGVDVRDYQQQALRRKVSISLQKSELFTTTIRENIAWGDPEAKEKAILQAAEIAQADSFIRATPNGYETPVAERGMSLSGGQKQRVSIARAILKPAEILIFDDATSALDLKTEADLYAALNQARPGSTKIIIAQRIASVRQADRIAVLNNGTIEACGTHRELLETCQTYRDIYDSQIGEEGADHAKQ